MDFQLVVIGAGPGGYVSAIRAAQLGLKVALVERDRVGGTCLNRGCIPTKTLMHTANALLEFSHYEKMGLKVQVDCDFEAMSSGKNATIAQLCDGILGLLKANKITLFEGNAKVIEPNKVQIGDNVVSTENILIAVGSEPVALPIAGMELALTSNEVLDSDVKNYKSITIIGGGVIGVEFATIYNALSCDVTIIEAADRIIPNFDREISQSLSMILKKRGVKIFTGAKLEKIEQGQHNKVCTFIAKDKEETVASEAVIVSVGRRPCTKDIFGDRLEINLERGYIPVDKNFETCVKGIYAVGDVVLGGIQLAHVASAQGAFVASIIAGKEIPVDLETIPSCVYTNPEIACVGKTEAEAKAQGIPFKTSKIIMTANSKSVIEYAERGFIKIVYNTETEEILGAQLMCSRATDMVPNFSIAISNKLKLSDISKVIIAHPTFAEGITEAIEDAHGLAIHMMPKAKAH